MASRLGRATSSHHHLRESMHSDNISNSRILKRGCPEACAREERTRQADAKPRFSSIHHTKSKAAWQARAQRSASRLVEDDGGLDGLLGLHAVEALGPLLELERLVDLCPPRQSSFSQTCELRDCLRCP